MSLVAERQYERVGGTKAAADHDHDLVHELSKRLDCVWRMDQYIANAGNKPQVRELWEKLKRQEQENVDRLKELIATEVREECF